MSGTDIHHLAAAYALDAVDDTERAAFEAHYPSCDVCSVDVTEFRATLAVVAAAQAVAPSARLKGRVMADIARTRQLSPRVPDLVAEMARRRDQHRRRLMTGLLAAAAMAIVAVVGLGVGHRLGTRSGYADAAAAVLDEPDARLLDLQGTVPGQFRVAWSQAAGRAVVIGDGLAAPGADRVYELWLIDAAGPHPMRLLDEASGGRVRQVVDVRDHPDAWGVTIEPHEGSDAPTTDVIFVATV